MMRAVFAAALATAVVAGAHAASAQDAQEKNSQEKKLTVQQQKMRDCAAKWKEEKAKTDVKGREAHNKFMSGCLKGQS
jgi:uncharacterized membrane protein